MLDKFTLIKFFGIILILIRILFLPIFLAKKSIDIIRANDPYYMGLIAYYFSKILRKPFVISIHSDYDKRYTLDGPKGSFTILGSRRVAKSLERFILKKSNYILPIRSYMIKVYNQGNLIPKKKFFVFPHGINLKEFDEVKHINIHEKFNIPEGQKILSFVGRLSKENYIDDILKIVKGVSKERDDFILLYVGGGNELNRLKKETENIDFVKILGYQNKEIVTNIQKQSYMSICLMGGFSLIEACAGSNPIISYNIEWHKELVKNDLTGYLLNESDLIGGTKKIIYLLNDIQKSKEMGKNSRKLVQKNHELKKTQQIKREFYERFL